jgi:hypothetical protein
MDPNGALTTMANNYTASWNNYQMRLYSSLPRVAWQNSLTSTARVEIESFWYGYYAALSSTNDVVYSIRSGLFKGKPDSAMVENLAYLLQGLTVGQLALNYDQGFVVDYNSDLSKLPINTRLQMRDWALAKLDTAIAMAATKAYTWPDAWTNAAGCGGGEPRAHAPAPCTNVSVGQIASTMAARLLAYFPRGAAETQTAAQWDRVKAYAATGISSTTPFDVGFVGDGCVKFCDELRLWSNDITTMRTDTRVANMLDTSQHTPWPDPNGNPRPGGDPNHAPSADKRLNDGTYGTTALAASVGTVPADAGAGTDYAWDAIAIFRPARGQYHQSNIGQIRYDYLGFSAPDGSGGGFGFAPVILAAENDLIWAEALIRGSVPDLVTAATLINKTRVTRGGLPAAAAADGVAGLLAKLQYEQDVELAGDGATPYYNRRRIDGLLPLTPHQMPIPAKELGVLGLVEYSFGGTGPAFIMAEPSGQIDSSSLPVVNASRLFQDAQRVWNEIDSNRMARIKSQR